MDIGLATTDEKKTVVQWVEQWGLFDKHESIHFSDDIYVVRTNNKPVLACGLMTFEDGKYIRLYGMIKDPELKSSREYMKPLINEMCSVAKEMGYKFIQLFAPSESLAKIYNESGFVAETKPLIPMRRDL